MSREEWHYFRLIIAIITVSAPSSSANGGPLNVEAILGAARAFPAIDILQQETDDETMVELAIALSLQVSVRISITLYLLRI